MEDKEVARLMARGDIAELNILMDEVKFLLAEANAENNIVLVDYYSDRVLQIRHRLDELEESVGV